MECARHPGSLAEAQCSRCKAGVCAACASYDVDGAVHCESCGREAEEKSHALGSAIIAFVGVGYLATLAVAVLVFHGKPYVGGLAAIVAIALGRTLQVLVKPPIVVRRARQAEDT